VSKRLLVATRKGLFIYENKADAWRVKQDAFLGAQVIQVVDDPDDGTIYAAVGHGHFGAKMHRSSDGGKTWQETAAPVYPPRPDHVPPTMDTMRNIEIAWTLQMIWELAIDPRKPGSLWAGTLPGGLFHSNDRGDSWTLNESLWMRPERAKWFGGGYDWPGIHSVLVDPRDANHLTLGVSCGGVWQTTDGGTNWALTCKGMRAAYMPPDMSEEEAVQDPHITVQSAGEPDKLWVQHHNGIFRSTDGGKRWTEIDKAGPSTFGFAAAAHPASGDTAWFVPAKKDEERVPVGGQFVVTRTSDGGKSFDVLTRGLPAVPAYDIVYRHGLAVDPTGERLAMGSTTGSLWYSSDGGDDWRTVSNHLPPIFSVRFAQSD
jgi:photosystem II stability/assembly factor-like uncharacterized protein